MSRKRANDRIHADLRGLQDRLRRTPDGIQVDLLKLRLMVGPHAFKALRQGLPLQRWRGTSPHNWWVENRRGDQLWHSDTVNWGHHPDLFMFEVAGQSGGTVPHHALHGDGGSPFHTDYVLKPEYRRGVQEPR